MVGAMKLIITGASGRMGKEMLAAVAAWLDVNILRKQPKFPK